MSETDKYEQYFKGRGKLLLSGEYFVLDGAKALALPMVLGQSMGISYGQSFTPRLRWKSYDVTGMLWFEAVYEFWHFNLVDTPSRPHHLFLQKILRQARKQNKHFLREEMDVLVETFLDFPLNWGMGSSSTLIHNIACWARVCPFELSARTTNGSGYDIACAQADGPIIFVKGITNKKWEGVDFHPSFKNNLFFVHLGRKQCSKSSIEDYNKYRPFPSETINRISEITDEMLAAKKIEDFNFAIFAHEEIVGKCLRLTPMKELLFPDFWGEVKSLGAWGGDMVLVTSDRGNKKTEEYFQEKGYLLCVPYDKLVLRRQYQDTQTRLSL